MSTVRIQIRRGESTDWESIDPVLADGEMGIEIDTNKVKVGNNGANWTDLPYLNVVPTDLDNTLGDYVLVSDVGNAGGPAKLDVDGNLLIPKSSIILEGSSADAYETTLTVTNPTVDRTITFPDATGTVALFSTTGDLTIPGNLVVSGESVAVNTEQVLIEDNEIVLNANISTGLPSLNAQLAVRRGSSSTAFLIWDESQDKWLFSDGLGNANIIASDIDINTAIDTEETNRNSAISTAVSDHSNDTTNVHGITDTANLATLDDIDGANTYADTAVSNHSDDTTNIHGIVNTADLATKTYADDAVSTHSSDTTSIHGIADTSELATKSYADNAVSTEAITTSSNIATAVSNHNSATTSIHGIADTSALATKTYVDDADALKADKSSPTFTGTVTIPTLSVTTTATGITKSMVGLGNVDNTTDADKPVSTATQTALNAKLDLAGGTMTGHLTLSGAPTSDLHAATKLYVDGLASGINFHQPVKAATAGNLNGTYNNGTNGYLATLTKASNGSIGTIDGVTVAVGNRILLRAQTDATENGIYTITALGDGSNPWQITRAVDADNNPSGELTNGDFCFVTSGSTNLSKGFILSTTGTISIGTSEITYSQFNASEAVIAGTNIDKTGATISVIDAPTFSGVITASSGVAYSDGTQTKEGVPSRTLIIPKTGSYTLTSLTERDSLIEVNSTSPVTITIPTNSAVSFPIGTTLDILGVNTGLITIAGDTGVTVNATPGLKLRTQWSSCTLFKRATDSWVVYGDLKA